MGLLSPCLASSAHSARVFGGISRYETINGCPGKHASVEQQQSQSMDSNNDETVSIWRKKNKKQCRPMATHDNNAHNADRGRHHGERGAASHRCSTRPLRNGAGQGRETWDGKEPR